jgi:hypothetical protein
VPRDVPGYHDVIKKPRCLEQIQRGLARRKYASPADLLVDVQLVWDNCREVGRVMSGRGLVWGNGDGGGCSSVSRQGQCHRRSLLPLLSASRAAGWRRPPGTFLQRCRAFCLLAQSCAPLPTNMYCLPLQYNEPDAPVVAEAAESEAYWQQCWAATGMPVPPRQPTAAQKAAAAAREAAAKEKLESTWRSAARKVGPCRARCGRARTFPGHPVDPPPPRHSVPQAIFRLQKVKESSWFWSPVREEDAPGYAAVVARPMDLATISDRLAGRGQPYASVQQFLADVQLVWDNCREVSGGAGTAVGGAARHAAASCSAASVGSPARKAWLRPFPGCWPWLHLRPRTCRPPPLNSCPAVQRRAARHHSRRGALPPRL